VRQSGTLLIRLPDRKAELGISDERYFLDEVHPSAEGHGLIAHWIHEALVADSEAWWLP
jgi:phospholipase/lecithinase/hemolysin